MAGFFSLPMSASLTSNGTASGMIGVASVTGWQLSSYVGLGDNTTTPPITAVIVAIDTTNNILYLQAVVLPSSGWAQMDSTLQTAPPALNEQVSWNPTDMSAWTTANSATVTQIPTFIYQNNGINGPV